jgi:hypothetical protein
MGFVALIPFLKRCALDNFAKRKALSAESRKGFSFVGVAGQ